jgi:hypothetical protein
MAMVDAEKPNEAQLEMLANGMKNLIRLLGNVAMGNVAMGNVAMGNVAMGNVAMGLDEPRH